MVQQAYCKGEEEKEEEDVVVVVEEEEEEEVKEVEVAKERRLWREKRRI